MNLTIRATDHAPSSQGALPASGYGLKFSDNSYMTATRVDDYDGFQQYCISDRSFIAGQEFQLYDFSNTAGWAVGINPYSFGGNQENEIWRNYLSYDGTKYTVLQDFKVSSFYIKLKMNADEVYIALA